MLAMHLVSLTVGVRGQAQAGEMRLLTATIAGGGNASRGGAYAIDATVGQPVAGPSRGANYELAAGFWPMVVTMQEPGAPALRMVLLNRRTSVAWPADARGFRLQSASALAPPGLWIDVKETPVLLGDEWMVAVPTSEQVQFYRLRRDP